MTEKGLEVVEDGQASRVSLLFIMLIYLYKPPDGNANYLP